MDTHALAPTPEIITEIEALQSTGFCDPSGARMARLTGYLESCELESIRLRLLSEDFADRQLATLLREAFEAARRIVQAAGEAPALAKPAD